MDANLLRLALEKGYVSDEEVRLLVRSALSVPEPVVEPTPEVPAETPAPEVAPETPVETPAEGTPEPAVENL